MNKAAAKNCHADADKFVDNPVQGCQMVYKEEIRMIRFRNPISDMNVLIENFKMM